MKKGFLRVIFANLLMLIAFIVVLSVASNFEWENNLYQQILNFLNQNLRIIVIFYLLFFLGELSFLFDFPVNVLGPIFNAFGGVFLVEFIFHILSFVGIMTNQNILEPLYILRTFIISIVFFAILIFGYIHILSEVKIKSIGTKKKKGKKKVKEESISWEDVGEQFKMALYNLGATFRRALEPEKKTK